MSVKNYVATIDSEQTEKLKFILENENWDMDTIPYAVFRARKNKTTCVAYESGKLVVQGKGTEELVQFTIEPQILGEARLGYETELALMENPEMFTAHAGIDESGKGDFFGPLVICCCYVNETTSVDLHRAGIQDSKAIKSDKKISDLAAIIRETTGYQYSIVRIGNEAYNRMYAKFNNLNRMLAWGHAQSLENLLEKQPGCQRAISDQFGRKSTVLSALKERGRQINLEQMTKAESDIAVAAASILARDEFNKSILKLQEEWKQDFPKGASKAVLNAAAAFIKTHGEDQLHMVSKSHFQTRQKAINLAGS